MCKHEGCKVKRGSFNFEGTKNGIYCKEHKLEGMIDVVHTKCIFVKDGKECNKQASSNIKGENKALYCKEHRTKEMVNVKSKLCIEPGCPKQPSYNYEGQKTKLYCGDHKKDDMVYLAFKKCIEKDCPTFASFNLKGLKNPVYCSEHKKEEMVNILVKSCKECNITASYGEKEGSPLYCNEHKKDNMILLRAIFCIEENCPKQPSYNYEESRMGIYCKEHKKEDMVRIGNKRCLKCNTRPIFNFKGEKEGIYCVKHKLEDMVDVISLSCLNCDTQACFNYEKENKPLYCSSHKLEGMIDIKNKSCKNEWCNIQVHYTKYEGYCLRCFIHIFPDKPTTLNYKTKERTVVDFVKTMYPQLTWVDDKTVRDGCSKRRPDLLLDLGYQVIIIEIDENQHIDYDCSCENKRIMELSQDVGHRPIVFLRFNPDNYIDSDKKIQSCWSLDGKGFCVIKKNKQKEWNDRLSSLKSQIDYWINPENKTDKTVEIIQLFYDC